MTMAFDIASIVSVILCLITLGSLMMKLGQILGREEAHSESLVLINKRLDELDKDRAEQRMILESIKGQIGQLRATEEALQKTLDRWIDRLEKIQDFHLTK